MHANGNFVVAWTDQAPGKPVTAKFCQFSASGTPLTDILEVTSSPNTMSGQVDVKIGTNGTLYFTWLDGRSGGQYGQIYAKKTTSVLATSVEKESVPISFSLGQNFPNPFNPSTTIRYALPSRSQVKLEILNLLGQRVAELVNTQEEAGHHQIEWQAPSGAASGIYFYRMEAVALDNSGRPPSAGSGRGFVETKKMLLIR